MQNSTHTNTAINAQSITPETSRMMRENMRVIIDNLLADFMLESKAYIVKLADFKKWCKMQYQTGHQDLERAQAYYIEAGFTGRNIGPWSSAPYGFWEYDRLDRWCAKLSNVRLYKKDGRILVDRWNVI